MQAFDICYVVVNNVANDRSIQKEAAALAANHWRVAAIGIARGGHASSPLEPADSYVTFQVSPQTLRSVLPGKAGWILRTIIGFIQMAIIVRRVNARVYTGRDFWGMVVIALAGKWHGPIVYESLEIYFQRPLPPATRFLKPILQRIEKMLARRASRIIVCSEGVSDFLARCLEVDPPTVVHLSLDPHVVMSPAPSILPMQHVVAHSGWLSKGRHLIEIVAAMRLLPDDVGLLLIGDGPLRPAIEEQARTLGISERVAITGTVSPSQLLDILAGGSLALVLITSDYESYRQALPNKFFEAIATGLPIVISPIPVVKQLTDQYDIGVACDPQDPQSIADAILAVLKDDNWERLRSNVLRCQQYENWTTEAVKLVNLYRDLLGELQTAAHETR